MDEELSRSTLKKKKRLISSSSSDEDTSFTRLKTPTCSSNDSISENKRSSARIRKRQNRTFSLPSREEILKDIPPDKNPEKDIRKLTPKKLVNNFTKENHRYNYDPVYTSGEESFEEFINDESESITSDSDSETKKKKRRQRRVKNYHPRIVKEVSDSSSENNSKKKINNISDSDSDSDIGIQLSRKSTRRKSKCIESDSEDVDEQKDKFSNARKKLYSDEGMGEEYKEDTESDIVAVDRNRTCIIESDEFSDESDNESKTVQNNIKELADNEPKSSSINQDTSANKTLDSSVVAVNNKRNSVEHDSCSNETDAICQVEDFEQRSSRHDSGIMADSETFTMSDSGTYASTSLIDTGVPGDEIDPDLLNEICQSDFNSSDTDSEDESASTESDIEITSERTRVLMAKKRRNKEKMFEKFRAAREAKLEKEARRRQSESQNETAQNHT